MAALFLSPPNRLVLKKQVKISRHITVLQSKTQLNAFLERTANVLCNIKEKHSIGLLDLLLLVVSSRSGNHGWLFTGRNAN